MLPYNKRVTQKRTCKQRVHRGIESIPLFLTVLLSILFNKLPWPKHRNFGTQTEKTEEKSTATPKYGLPPRQISYVVILSHR